jgi:predicted Zn-dependent protease
MRKQRDFFRWALLLLAICCARRVQAQQACPSPPAVSAAPGANIFLPQQETMLGDLMAEQMDHRYQVLDAPELTAYLDRVAGRLLAQLPPTGLQFQIILIDRPVVDAFSTPGGRIYVTRKTGSRCLF